MEIKVKEIELNQLINEETADLIEARKPSKFLNFIIFIIATITLFFKGFKYKNINLTKDIKKKPCLILMNHGSFLDVLIASRILKFHSYNIMAMHEAFIGRKDLLSKLGCFPTHKFVSSPVTVVTSMRLVNELDQSILVFPEGAYSFDGTSSPLSPNLSKYIKCLRVPVLFIKTRGSYLSQPLYNHLKKRKTKISATIECLLSKSDVINKDLDEIQNIVNNKFKDINYFQEQLEDKQLIKNKDRIDYLESVLYKCPHCLSEGDMVARGISIKCKKCGEEYILNEDGTLTNKNNKTIFKSIPEWYKWERECVRKEIIEKKYNEEFCCEIFAVKNFEYLYHLKEKGFLKHNLSDNFELTVNNDKYLFNSNNFTLNADLYFYSLGDVISVSNNNVKYFLMPCNKFCGIVTKIRFAVEEHYKICNIKGVN